MSRTSRNAVLTLTAGSFFATMVARLVLSPVVPLVGDAFHVTKGLVGLALTGMWAAYAVFQFPSGVLAGRFGERRVILVALALTAAGSLATAAAPSYGWFALAVLFLGTGAGLYYSAGAALLFRRFENTDLALSVHEMGAPLGGLVGPVVGAYVGVRYGWNAAPLFAACVAGALLLLVAAVVRPGPRTPSAPRERLDPRLLVSLFGRPPVAFSAFVAVVGFFSVQSYVSFFPTFLVQYVGLTPERAGVVFGATFLVAAAFAPVAGRLADWGARDLVLAAAFLAGGVGVAVFLAADGFVTTVVGTLCVGVGTGWGGVVNSRLVDGLPVEGRSSGFGLARSTVLLLGSLGSVVTGTLAERAGWVTAYGLVVGLFVVAALALTVAYVFVPTLAAGDSE